MTKPQSYAPCSRNSEGQISCKIHSAADVGLDNRNNVATDANYATNVPGVFAAGDLRRGQSLVVWAIAEGRKAAEGMHRYLMSSESLAAGHA